MEVVQIRNMTIQTATENISDWNQLTIARRDCLLTCTQGRINHSGDLIPT